MFTFLWQWILSNLTYSEYFPPVVGISLHNLAYSEYSPQLSYILL